MMNHPRNPRRVYTLGAVSWLVWVTVMLLASGSAYAQASSDQTRILGTITDQRGRFIKDVLITARILDDDFGGVARSGQDGSFSIDELPVGKYEIIAEKNGYGRYVARIDASATGVPSLSIGLNRMMGLLPPDPSLKRPQNYATVSIMYGTDREVSASDHSSRSYSGRRGRLELGRMEVSVPRRHRMGKLESRKIWRRVFRPDPKKDITVLDTAQTTVDQFGAALNSQSQGPGNMGAMLFIHGYNVTFEDAGRRTAQLAYDLGFKGQIIFYSWPSNGSEAAYVSDTTDAEWSAAHLSEFLRLVAEHVRPVHVIAHSMGNRTLSYAATNLVNDSAGSLQRVGQVVLVAPDVDADLFKDKFASAIVNLGISVTMYGSTIDKALKLSGFLRDQYPRVGDFSKGVVTLPGIYTIDASNAKTDFVGHTWFAEHRSVIGDLFYVIRGDVDPGERFGLLERPNHGNLYWEILP